MSKAPRRGRGAGRRKVKALAFEAAHAGKPKHYLLNDDGSLYLGLLRGQVALQGLKLG